LLAHLKNHQGDVAKHVVGSVVVDEKHLTEDQLLSKEGQRLIAEWRPVSRSGRAWRSSPSGRMRTRRW